MPASSNSVMIYEVLLTDIEADIFAGMLEFLKTEHVPEVVTSGHFLGAEIHTCEEERLIRVQYRHDSQRKLEAYLKEKAPALREKTAKAFPSGFKAQRKIWQVQGQLLGQ